jgi:Flp pilus assembly pilin Flp
LRFFRDKSGSPAVEFALIAPVLSTWLLGVVDFSTYEWRLMQVGNAARAGAEYAIARGYNPVFVANAITEATGWESISPNPAPSLACGCPNATAGIVSASCGSGCASGGTAGIYVTSSAQAEFSPLFPWPGLKSPVMLSYTAKVRIN